MRMAGYIAVHSFRGGTGKTTFALNLSLVEAMKGRNVCIMDMDLRAPNVASILGLKPKLWINDYLNGEISIRESAIDITKDFNLSGKFLIVPANPNMQDIRAYVMRSRKWEINALKRLLDTRSILLDEMGMNRVVMDTSPGISYLSINSLAASDVALIITSSDSNDIEATAKMVKYFYNAIGCEPFVIVNRFIGDSSQLKKVSDKVYSIVGAPVIGVINCYCDLVRYESPKLLVLENPTHPYVKSLQDISEKISELI